MKLYRAGREHHLEDFEGTKGNSFKKGARWNLPYNPVLYFAPSPSIAAMELAQYFPTPDLVPDDYVMGEFEIPDSLKSKTLSIEDLPENWHIYPHPQCTKEIGTAWLQKVEELCLFVPSAATPGYRENIIVVNPRHGDINQIKLINIIDKIYPERMFQGLKKV